MRRSFLSAGEFLIERNDENNEEEALTREGNVSRRASEQIRIEPEGNAVARTNLSSNLEIRRNDEESGIEGNVYKSSVIHCAVEVTEKRPKNNGQHRKSKPSSIAKSKIKQAGSKVTFYPTRVQSEICQSNPTSCNEFERNPSYFNNPYEEQVISSGGERSSAIGRLRKFNPASVVNSETEHAGSNVLFPPRPFQSDAFQNTTAEGCNDFQRKHRESSCNKMQKKVVTYNGESRPSGTYHHEELIPALLPIYSFQQSGLKVAHPPLNYQPDIHRHNAPIYDESQGNDHEKLPYNTTEKQASLVASRNESQRKEHKSACSDTNEYLVFCSGENRPNGVARCRKFKPSSVAILDSEQACINVPYPPSSMQSDMFHSTTANRNGFQSKDDLDFSFDTHEQQVQKKPSFTKRRSKINPASNISYETRQAGFQVPFLPSRMQSDVSENNATGCIGFQGKDHRAFHNIHDEQIDSNGKNSGIARRRKLNPAFVVSSEIHPQFPLSMQSNVFENNANCSNDFKRKHNKSLCNKIHKDLVTQNGKYGPIDNARQREFNAASESTFENQPAGLQVQFLPRRGQADLDQNHSPAICRLRQRRGNEASCNSFDEEQVTCISENNASGIKRHSTLNSSSVAFEQVRLPFLPRVNVQPRRHPRGRKPRVAVCSGSESTDLERERMRARALLKRFGDLKIPDTPYNPQ